MAVINGFFTVFLLILFIGIWVWAWSKSNKSNFERMANLPLEEGAALNEEVTADE